MYFSPMAIAAFFAVISAPTAFAEHTSSLVSVTYKSLDDSHITPNQISKVKDTLISTANRSYYPNRDVVGEITFIEPTITKAVVSQRTDDDDVVDDEVNPARDHGPESLPSGMWNGGYQYEFEIETCCVCGICGDVSTGEGCDCNRCMGDHTAAPGVVDGDGDVVVSTETIGGGSSEKSDYILHWERHFCGMMSIGGSPIDDCEITISPTSDEAATDNVSAEEDLEN